MRYNWNVAMFHSLQMEKVNKNINILPGKLQHKTTLFIRIQNTQEP